MSNRNIKLNMPNQVIQERAAEARRSGPKDRVDDQRRLAGIRGVMWTGNSQDAPLLISGTNRKILTSENSLPQITNKTRQRMSIEKKKKKKSKKIKRSIGPPVVSLD